MKNDVDREKLDSLINNIQCHYIFHKEFPFGLIPPVVRYMIQNIKLIGLRIISELRYPTNWEIIDI